VVAKGLGRVARPLSRPFLESRGVTYAFKKKAPVSPCGAVQGQKKNSQEKTIAWGASGQASPDTARTSLKAQSGGSPKVFSRHSCLAA
jgi:hypothetical protein